MEKVTIEMDLEDAVSAMEDLKNYKRIIAEKAEWYISKGKIVPYFIKQNIETLDRNIQDLEKAIFQKQPPKHPTGGLSGVATRALIMASQQKGGNKMSETKHTCGECFHFDACRKMMESVLDPTWNVAIIPVEKGHACQDFIEASLVMSAFRTAERLRGAKETKPSKKCVTIKLPLSEAMTLRTMAGSRVDKVYDSISIYEDDGVKVPAWLEAELKEKSGIYDKIAQAIDDYYR